MKKNMSFINSNMKFSHNLNAKCIDGNFEIAKDSSLTYEVNTGGFSVLLGGYWAFSLIVNHETGLCEGFESFLNALNYSECKLMLPNSTKGELYFNCDEKLLRGSGCHYYPFDNNIYYDENQLVMCVGNKDKLGKAVEFAKNIIAVIDNNQLVAIYLKLPNSEWC